MSVSSLDMDILNKVLNHTHVKITNKGMAQQLRALVTPQSTQVHYLAPTGSSTTILTQWIWLSHKDIHACQTPMHMKNNYELPLLPSLPIKLPSYVKNNYK